MPVQERLAVTDGYLYVDDISAVSLQVDQEVTEQLLLLLLVPTLLPLLSLGDGEGNDVPGIHHRPLLDNDEHMHTAQYRYN